MRQSGSRVGGGCVSLFFGIFLLAGLGFLFPFAKAAWQMVESRGWEEVDCRVVSSRLGSSSDDDGTTYRVEITFEYAYLGEERTGDRHDFLSSMYTSGSKGKQRLVDRYSAGSSCRAWVDPQNPSQAVLDRGPSAAMGFALIPLVFVLVGGGGVAAGLGWGFFERLGRKGAKPSQVGRAVTPSREIPSGPLVLKPAMGPVGKVVGILAVAGFWNGIVGIFVVQLWKDWSSGAFDWFRFLFLIPFELIGLGLLGAIPYVVLQSFNPRAILELDRSNLALGDEVDLRWRFRGRTARLRRLTLRLKGQESASYTVGTDTRTVTSTFHEEIVFETRHLQAMKIGAARLRIPGDSMHTFKAPRNRIEWCLELHGEIPRWPDVDDSYPLDIAPHADTARAGDGKTDASEDR